MTRQGFHLPKGATLGGKVGTLTLFLEKTAKSHSVAG